jgi:hypothetical protein
MSERPLIKQYPSILNGDMSGNITGLPSIIMRIPMISYSFSWSGSSPVGTISIQVSNDYSENAMGQVQNAGTWNNLPLVYNGSSVTVVPLSGSSGNGFIDVDSLAGYAIRPVYNFTSGTGTLQAICMAKVT